MRLPRIACPGPPSVPGAGGSDPIATHQTMHTRLDDAMSNKIAYYAYNAVFLALLVAFVIALAR